MTGLENLWHMYYMLMVCINDCNDRYSYVCMHVRHHSYKSIVGGIHASHMSQVVVFDGVCKNDRNVTLVWR